MKKELSVRLQNLDWVSWLKNAALFLAPAALLFLLSVQGGSSVEQALVYVKLWLLNTAIDVIRKFIQAG